jgi:hypothetical protein
VGLFSCLLLIGSFAVATQAASAQEQRGASDQYEPNPPPPPNVLPESGGGNNGNPNGDLGPDGNAGNGDDNGDGNGNLPFTGYPVTTLILLMLALVLVGTALRAGALAFKRARETPSAGA